MSGQIVVVTGASAGIGRACARAFAARGDTVALLARGGTGLAAAAEEVERRGGHALAIETDVANYQQVSAAASVEEEFGPIDIWVNDAMAKVFAKFTDIDAAEFRRATEASYLG